MLLTRRELVQTRKEVRVPKVEEKVEEEARDETLWRMHHPDHVDSSPINATFDYNGYEVKIQKGVALIPAWLVPDFEGMGYTKGRKYEEDF
ncbi:MAG: hypothetical protein HDQ88_03655 [Clostridia bacterium]|nr:hypothetical protein [Clostridia bacterium]